MDLRVLYDRVNRIEAEIKERKPHKGLELKINITGVREDGNNLIFAYDYTVRYKEVGEIRIIGDLFVEASEKDRKEVLDKWEKDKNLGTEIMEKLLNNINYACTAHSTIIARVLNYFPPLVPPRFSIKNKE